MELNGLKEQSEQVHDAAEARAAAAAASVEADEGSASQSRPSSSKNKSRRPSAQTQSVDSRQKVETQFGETMANPDAAVDQAIHSRPLQDSSLPDEGLGSDPPPQAAADTSSTQAEQLISPHNLLAATELIQAGGHPLSPFAPAPILRLNAIRISGAGRALRPGYLASLCRPYMDPTLSTQNPEVSVLSSLYYGSRTSHVLPGQPTTLPSILALTSSLAGDLDKLDVFRSIEASLAPSMFPGASEEDVDVILACSKPKGRVFLKSSTDVGNGEGSASVQGRIRNVFGGAETLQGSATFGTRTKQAFNLEFGGPLPGNPDTEYKLAAFSHDRDYSAFASLYEAVKGLRASINSSFSTEPRGVINPDDSEDGEGAQATRITQHELAYEASLRELGWVMGDASVAVRKMAVHPSVKSALSWTWVRESRDNPVLPSKGSKVRTVVEYAGLGGDANHVKAEVEASTGRHFSPLNWLSPSPSSSTPSTLLDGAKPDPVSTSTEAEAVISSTARSFHPIFSTLTFRSGLLHPLNPTNPTHFSDRFQLGGPTSLRMFRHSSLGPKCDRDSLGGDAFWSLGLSLLSPIPKKPHWPLMLHTFVNVGQMCQLNPIPSTSNYLNSLKQITQASSSVGLGLVYIQGQLRVELNAGLPLTARKGDGMRKGLQLGIGIDFL